MYPLAQLLEMLFIARIMNGTNPTFVRSPPPRVVEKKLQGNLEQILPAPTIGFGDRVFESCWRHSSAVGPNPPRSALRSQP